MKEKKTLNYHNFIEINDVTDKPKHSVDDWESIFECSIKEQMDFDPAHDIAHVKRVVKSAKLIAKSEGRILMSSFPPPGFTTVSMFQDIKATTPTIVGRRSITIRF